MSNLVGADKKDKVTRQTALDLLPERFTRLFVEMDDTIANLTEVELEEHFNRTPTDWAFRKKLWETVDEALGSGADHIVVDTLCKGVIDTGYLYNRMVNNHYRISWIFTPLQTFQVMYEESFHIVFNKIRKFVLKTEVNSDNVKDFLKIAQEFGNRTIGPVIQKVDTRILARHQHEHKNLSATLPPNDIDKQIEALEQAKLVSSAREVKEPE